MKIVLQRVSSASVTIAQTEVASIQKGLVLLVGIVADDTKEDIDWLCQKIVGMRIFSDENNKMNKSILDCNGNIIVVSQFTLHASTKKGNRPSFINAARPEIAIPLYETFKTTLEHKLEKPVQSGQFGADMKVALCNDGPVTIVIDSKQKQ